MMYNLIVSCPEGMRELLVESQSFVQNEKGYTAL